MESLHCHYGSRTQECLELFETDLEIGWPGPLAVGVVEWKETRDQCVCTYPTRNLPNAQFGFAAHTST